MIENSAMVAKSAPSNSRPRRGRWRRVPPGQRLIFYLMLAGLIVGMEGLRLPAGHRSGASPTAEVPIEQPFRLTEPMNALAGPLEKLCAQEKLRPGVFVAEPSTGRYADLHGREQFAAASIIKVPILVKALVAMDRQILSPDETLVIRKELLAGGSGYLQWRPLGSKVTVREAAELMIVVSDNTATNLIVDALGGKDKLNRDFAAWGLNSTRINNWLPDFAGTNKTSPYDIAYLLAKIDQGSLISEQSRSFMYSLMERVKTRTLLPKGLGQGTRIAHKTGDIGVMVGDAGLVTLADGRKYVIAVQVERPHNDRRANQLIRDVSKLVYSEFTGAPAANGATSPEPQAEKPR